jgi:hypothetical protein
VLEARKTEGECLMDELKTEPDKLYNSTTKAVRTSKSSKKPPITKKNIFYGKRKVFNR